MCVYLENKRVLHAKQAIQYFRQVKQTLTVMIICLPLRIGIIFRIMQTTLEPKPFHSWPWIMLVFRTSMFALWQAVIARRLSAHWCVIPLAGIHRLVAGGRFLSQPVTLFVLLRLFHGEGLRFWDIFRFERATLKGDLLVLLGFLIVVGPIALLPSYFLGAALFGNYLSAVDMLYHPLPLWAILPALFLFPSTIALVDCPITSPTLCRGWKNK